MTEFDLKKLQMTELGMLKDISAFCDEHGIRYFMYGGTLLGAARHQGFIPWDDDIDIWMDHKSYQRFLSLADALSDKYFIQNYKTEKKLCYPWTKVILKNTVNIARGLEDYDIRQGINIDVFMINGIADGRLRGKIQRRALKIKKSLLNKFYYIEVKKKKPVTLVRLTPEFLRRPLISLMEALSDIDPFRCEKCYGNDHGNISMAKIYPSEMFLPENTIRLPFEDGEFAAPKAYEQFLTITFDDWRTIPPAEQRKTHDPVVIDYESDSRA